MAQPRITKSSDAARHRDAPSPFTPGKPVSAPARSDRRAGDSDDVALSEGGRAS